MGEKQSVQNFQWDGSAPRIEGKMVWFRSIDGSEHGWPQLTDHEAMRLALFLHGSQQRAASERAEKVRSDLHQIRDRIDKLLAQRAASVRVVQIIETNTTNEPLNLMRGGPLKPGQSLAVIERPAEAVKDAGWVKVNEATVARPFTIEADESDESAEAAAGEGAVSMCMGCLGTGHMEGFGRCPHCKGTGECPHNKKSAARHADGEEK